MKTDIFEWTADWAIGSGLKLWRTDETTSTNSVAKDDVEESTAPRLESESSLLSAPTLYLARHQTQGRGRGTNVWVDPAGGSLLSSWSFALSHVPQPILSPLVGLALFEAAKNVWPKIEFNMKAPNDLFIGSKKVAGLLIETIDQGKEKRTAIGLGLNVTARPQLETATDLVSHLSAADYELNRKNWCLFLDLWVARLKAAVQSGLSTYLDLDAQEKLRTALNLHPLLKEPVLAVDAQGQLHLKSGIVRWQEL